MKFEVIDFSNKDKWHEIVKEKEIYYQWEYIDAFYQNNEGEPFLAYAKCNNDYIFNVYLKRDINDVDMFKNEIEQNKYFDIITPYGYGGVDIIGEENQELLDFYFEKFMKYCEENNIISEFVRLNPLSDNYRFYSKTNYELIQFSKTIYIKLENEEQIWNDLKSTCRNRIRKAINSKLIVKSGFDKKMLDEFKIIYSDTMKRDNAIDYYLFDDAFFENVFENLKNNAIIYTAYLDDKAVDSILVLYSSENSHYHLGGTLSEYMNLGAHNLVLYKAAVDMCNKGYKKFHLGGGYGGDDSPLLRFKRTFTKDGELDFYIAKKIFNKEIYDKLVSIRKKDNNFDENSKFFPLYRSI